MSKQPTKKEIALPVFTARGAELGKTRKQSTKENSTQRSFVQYSGEVIGPPTVGSPWTGEIDVKVEYSVEREPGRTTQRFVLRASKRGLLILVSSAILVYGAVTRDPGVVRRLINAVANTLNSTKAPKNGQ